jgi:hypothetical protein
MSHLLLLSGIQNNNKRDTEPADATETERHPDRVRYRGELR